MKVGLLNNKVGLTVFSNDRSLNTPIHPFTQTNFKIGRDSDL